MPTPRNCDQLDAGTMLIVSAPSGAGKTSLVRALTDARPHTRLSVSFTTRPPRPGERDGVDYCFVTMSDFESRRQAGEFLEYAKVHGNYYATSRRWIDEQMIAGSDVVLEVDWQGARQLRALYPMATSVFILPPSLDALRERLVTRGKDSDEVIARRIAAARSEIAHLDEFQYVIINQEFSCASGQLICLADSARLKTAPQVARNGALFDSLCGG